MVNRDKTLKHALLTGAGLGESKSNENCSSGKGCVLKAALEEHLQHRKEPFMRIAESAASFVDHVVALPNFPICSFQEDYEKILFFFLVSIFLLLAGALHLLLSTVIE